MEDLLRFLSFSDPNVRMVTLGTVMLSVSSAVVGVFTFLKKKSLVSDAVSHAVLPGICIAFWWTGTKNPLALTIGATFSGWLALQAIDLISRHSRIKEDTAIALVLSVFFGIGILLLTAIQHSGNAAQSGLDSFLFGKAAALVGTDLYVFGGLGLCLLATIFLFYKELKIISFDPQFARSVGLPVRRLDQLLTLLTMLAVVSGIQAVGMVLMAAMLVTPVVSARFWTHRLPVLIGLSAFFGALAALAGAFWSYTAPATPTGPSIVLAATLLAVASLIAAPERGLLSRWQRRRQHRRRVLAENVLKEWYKLGEADQQFLAPRIPQPDALKWKGSPRALRQTLQSLRQDGYLTRTGPHWQLTPEGYEKGRRLARLHRLWELYLTEFLHLPPEHVHDDAETIEHLLTPELEKRIEERLNFPRYDPHRSPIPK